MGGGGGGGGVGAVQSYEPSLYGKGLDFLLQCSMLMAPSFVLAALTTYAQAKRNGIAPGL